MSDENEDGPDLSKLDAAAGKRLWYQGVEPHDLMKGISKRMHERFGHRHGKVMDGASHTTLLSEIADTKREMLEVMNSQICALTNEGGEFMSCYYQPDPEQPGGEVLKLQSMAKFLTANRNIKMISGSVLDEGVVRLTHEPVAKFWCDSPDRRSYVGMTLNPEQPPGEAIHGHLNLWRGFKVKPRQGDWTKMKSHIHTVLAGGDQAAFDYIIRWFAWKLQNPAQLPETALCLVGGQGTGKTTVGRWMLAIFGIHAMRPSASGQLSGRFNFSLRDKLFILMDEAINPDSKAAANVIKGLITDESIGLEPKNREVVMCQNRMGMLILSNHDHFVSVEKGDRRFAVFRVSDAQKEKADYFRELYAEVNDGGLEAMLFDLLAMKLGTWHPRQNIPETSERNTQKALSLDGVDRAVHDLLATGDGPFMVLKKDQVTGRLFLPSTAFREEWARRKVTFAPQVLSPLLQLLGFERHKDDDSKTNGYYPPDIQDARTKWEELGRPRNWDDSVTSWGRTPTTF